MNQKPAKQVTHGMLMNASANAKLKLAQTHFNTLIPKLANVPADQRLAEKEENSLSMIASAIASNKNVTVLNTSTTMIAPASAFPKSVETTSTSTLVTALAFAPSQPEPESALVLLTGAQHPAHANVMFL